MGVKLVSASGGSVELNPPTTASNFTLTVPAANTTIVGTDTAQTLTNKTLTTPNFDSAQVASVSGTAPLYMCRAWVNFNGTGTVAIRGSGNVSSITDGGTGTYTINFSTALVDTSYALTGTAYTIGVSAGVMGIDTANTGSVKIQTVQSNTMGVVDYLQISAAIFR